MVEEKEEYQWDLTGEERLELARLFCQREGLNHMMKSIFKMQTVLAEQELGWWDKLRKRLPLISMNQDRIVATPIMGGKVWVRGKVPELDGTRYD